MVEILHQLILLLIVWLLPIYKGLYIPDGAGLLNHQQYHLQFLMIFFTKKTERLKELNTIV